METSPDFFKKAKIEEINSIRNYEIKIVKKQEEELIENR